LRKPGKTATGQDAHTNAQEEGPNLRNFKYISGKEDEPWTKTIKESKRRCFNNICEEIDSNPWSFATRHKAAAVPSRRKTQRLVLIPKAEKPAEEPSSYRPLCILDTVGKILEKIIHSRLKGAGIAFYSCYLPPSIPRQYLRSTRLQKTPKHPQAISALDEIAEGARENHPAVIAGDYNAWATEWGPPRTNARGKALLQSFALDLVLLNSGTKPTFSRAGTSL